MKPPGPQSSEFRAGTQHLRKQEQEWPVALLVIGICTALAAVGVAIALDAMQVPPK